MSKRVIQRCPHECLVAIPEKDFYYCINCHRIVGRQFVIDSMEKDRVFDIIGNTVTNGDKQCTHED
jgi:hypothetical protein